MYQCFNDLDRIFSFTRPSSVKRLPVSTSFIVIQCPVSIMFPSQTPSRVKNQFTPCRVEKLTVSNNLQCRKSYRVTLGKLTKRRFICTSLVGEQPEAPLDVLHCRRSCALTCWPCLITICRNSVCRTRHPRPCT